MFLTEVDIDDLENAGIVYNLPKKLINIGIDFNMINTLNEKELHYSHTKAYHIIKESYPDLIRQFVSFIDSDEKVQERSNSNLNLSLVEWSDKQTRYVDKTQLKNKKKAFNFTDKKHYSTLKPYQYNPRKDITKFNSLNKPKVCSTKSVFYSFLNRNINKFEEKDAVTFLTIERKNTVSDASHINTYLHNHNHCIVLEKTSLKIAMQNFAKAVVNEELNGVIFYNYKSLSLFLVNFDLSFRLSKQSLSNYKRRKLIFKTFMLNNKIISFFNYVKESYPLFDTKAFLSLCHKDELAPSKNIKHTNFATTNLTFGRNRRYFSISTDHNQNKFHNNSINEAGRAC
jgi:hypothetical protein